MKLNQILADINQQAVGEIDWSGNTYQSIRVDYVDQYYIDIEFTFRLEKFEMDGYQFTEAELDSVFIYDAFRNEDDETMTDISELVRKELQFECKNVY